MGKPMITKRISCEYCGKGHDVTLQKGRGAQGRKAYCSDDCYAKDKGGTVVVLKNDVDLLKGVKGDYENRSDLFNKVNNHNKVA